MRSKRSILLLQLGCACVLTLLAVTPQLRKRRRPPLPVVLAKPSPNLEEICVLVPVSSRGRSWATIFDSDLLRVILPSVERTCEPLQFRHRVLVGYDAADGFFNRSGIRSALLAHIRGSFSRFDATLLNFSNPLQKPGPVMNGLSRAAHDAGCDFMYRVNDDTEFVSPWATPLVRALRGFDPPLIGVVGPTCMKGITAILTHDFVHRSHLDIFGHHYPPVLTDWWLDDWISLVYGPNRTLKHPGVTVIHRLSATRYVVTAENQHRLRSEVEVDQLLLGRYLMRFHGLPPGDARNKQPPDRRVAVIMLTSHHTASKRLPNMRKLYDNEDPAARAQVDTFYVIEREASKIDLSPWQPMVAHGCSDSYTGGLCCKLQYAYRHLSSKYEWVLRVVDDGLVNYRNLLAYTRTMDPREPYYLGEYFSHTYGYGRQYGDGGGGWLLSQQALAQLVPNLNRFWTQGDESCYDDVHFGRFMLEVMNMSIRQGLGMYNEFMTLTGDDRILLTPSYPQFHDHPNKQALEPIITWHARETSEKDLDSLLRMQRIIQEAKTVPYIVHSPAAS